MAPTLHGVASSTCTARVGTVLKELGLKVDFDSIVFTSGAHKTPAYLEHQPFGQVPYLSDGAFEVYESRAIARYVARKYPAAGAPPLVPDPLDVEAGARFDQAASVELSNFDPFAVAITRERVFKPLYQGLPGDDALAAENEKILDGKLDGYERILKKQKYVAGDSLTLVDLFHLPYGTLITSAGYDGLTNAEKRPNVARWWKEISSRPSWQAVKNGFTP